MLFFFPKKFLYSDIFDEWQQEDKCFVPTKASKEVDNKTKHQNLVIVTGDSGSGKSTIVHHIALKYKEQGWNMIPVMEVTEIMKICPTLDKPLFVLNDPIGKESFDELFYSSWQKYEEMLKSNLKKCKLLVTCRRNVLSNSTVKGILSDKSNIVDISCHQYAFSSSEKRQILNRHTSNMNLTEEECVEILKIEKYFPLLCKLYSGKSKFQNIGLKFFKDPVTDLEKEINEYRQNKIEKYCALFLLVLFNNDLSVRILLENDVSKKKFKHALKLCGMDQNTNPYIIGETLESLKGFMVKKIGATYQFYHDFVMGIIIHVFGRNYPVEIIMYSEKGFLRRRIIFSFYKEHKDLFTIYLNGGHIEKLGKRLFVEMFRDRF